MAHETGKHHSGHAGAGSSERDPRAKGSSARVGGIYPSLVYDDAPAAIEWLCRAFGFEKRLIVTGPGGEIQHSELSFGEAVIMVSSPRPAWKWIGPRRLAGHSQSLSLFVAEPDAHYERAKAAGAVIMRELRDEEYGARGYMAQDLEGHQWYFGDYRPGGYWTT